jgi:hypothetical protein
VAHVLRTAPKFVFMDGRNKQEKPLCRESNPITASRRPDHVPGHTSQSIVPTSMSGRCLSALEVSNTNLESFSRVLQPSQSHSPIFKHHINGEEWKFRNNSLRKLLLIVSSASSLCPLNAVSVADCTRPGSNPSSTNTPGHWPPQPP